MTGTEGWDEVAGALQREFRFEGFPEAIEFVNRVAVLAVVVVWIVWRWSKRYDDDDDGGSGEGG